MNRPYKKSKIIKNLVPWDKDPRAIGTKILAEMFVTLHMFKIIKEISIEHLGPSVWEYAAMSFSNRNYNKPVNIDKFN